LTEGSESVTPLVRAVTHVQVAIPVGGEDEARGFYGGLLGLAEVAKPPELAKRGGCWFELPEGTCGQLHLGVDPDFRPAKKAHVAFVVSNVTKLAEMARSQGYEVLEVHDDESEQVYIYDPFGNRLEFRADD
jgi:catechol 2,3-dioxygenase-like lactoylglutathione lyase family enzyme